MAEAPGAVLRDAEGALAPRPAPAEYVPCRLETRDGAHVRTVYVPPFAIPPDALLWGDRLFLHQFINPWDIRPGFSLRSVEVYREAVAVAVMPGHERRAASPKMEGGAA